jgi:hypothetical protein
MSSGAFPAMPATGNLLAWIEPREPEEFVAGFVGAGAAHVRAPATQRFPSSGEARRWIEDQAASFGLPIEWVNKPPRR